MRRGTISHWNYGQRRYAEQNVKVKGNGKKSLVHFPFSATPIRTCQRSLACTHNYVLAFVGFSDVAFRQIPTTVGRSCLICFLQNYNTPFLRRVQRDVESWIGRPVVFYLVSDVEWNLLWRCWLADRQQQGRHRNELQCRPMWPCNWCDTSARNPSKSDCSMSPIRSNTPKMAARS